MTAVTLVAEVGDFRRFAKAEDFMGYVGLIPSEQTSGDHRRQGPITKTGNAHVRHVLVESAWHYRRQPRMSKALRERSAGISPQICAIAWKAQKRLHGRLNRLIGRGKNKGEAVTAVAGNWRVSSGRSAGSVHAQREWEARNLGFDEADLSPWCQSRRMEKGGIVPPPFGLGPRDGAGVVSPRSPVLRPGQGSS